MLSMMSIPTRIIEWKNLKPHAQCFGIRLWFHNTRRHPTGCASSTAKNTLLAYSSALQDGPHTRNNTTQHKLLPEFWLFTKWIKNSLRASRRTALPPSSARWVSECLWEGEFVPFQSFCASAQQQQTNKVLIVVEEFLVCFKLNSNNKNQSLERFFLVIIVMSQILTGRRGTASSVHSEREESSIYPGL